MYSNAEATVPTAAFGAQPALMGYASSVRMGKTK
jgi:hypothetical protein